MKKEHAQAIEVLKGKAKNFAVTVLEHEVSGTAMVTASFLLGGEHEEIRQLANKGDSRDDAIGFVLDGAARRLAGKS